MREAGQRPGPVFSFCVGPGAADTGQGTPHELDLGFTVSHVEERGELQGRVTFHSLCCGNIVS